MNQHIKQTLFFTIIVLLISQPLLADTFFVNNQTGSDDNDGTTLNTAMSTIQHAVSLCKAGDTISLAKTEVAYRESMELRKQENSAAKPFLIEGNDAVLTGLSLLDSKKWKYVEGDVYFYSFGKAPYGNPFLVMNNKRIKPAASIKKLQPEEHYWDRKTGIYFRCATSKKISDYPLEATTRVSGLILQNASYVICRNLSCEYFSNDGFNIHGDCRGIRLENVIARHNGDDGISIHETGGLVVQHAHLHHNFFGLQDVNASRSSYNGMLIEDNQVGVSMVGGYHSLVDSIVRCNVRAQIDIAGTAPKHLIGSEFNPLCKTIFFAQNVLLQGDGSAVGVKVGNNSQAVFRNCVISNSKVGLIVLKLGECHLTTSLIEKCNIDITSHTKKLFSDYNIFTNGTMQWMNERFQPKQWKDYREKSKHNEHSRIGVAVVSATGKVTIPPKSTARGIGKRVGVTTGIVNGYLED